jgi:hypothetical protein
MMMYMYQILCGHVNYALGKTRMWVKKTKRHFILDSCLSPENSKIILSIASSVYFISSSSSSSQPILL